MTTSGVTLAWIGPTEWLVIVGVLVLLFGAKKIPQLARGIGSSFAEFKKGLREAETIDLDAPPAPTRMAPPQEEVLPPPGFKGEVLARLREAERARGLAYPTPLERDFTLLEEVRDGSS